MEYVSFGYWVHRRRVALDLTQSALAHRVGCATITIKKIEHDERRPSRVMAQRLADELLVPDIERESFIQTALGEVYAPSLPIPADPLAFHPPAFIPEPVTDYQDQFVGRESELTWLDERLRCVLSGEGQIAFIAGSSGRGKTALMLEFMQQALDAQPELIASGGICTAYTGLGDPYLPFREVLEFLTGNLDSHWLAKTNHRSVAQRIWRALPHTYQSLADHAPYLIDVLVSGKDLLRCAATVAPGGAAWLAQLQLEVTQHHKDTSLPGKTALYGQFSSLLSYLSGRQPLLILLDDLHWADDASLGLLFHLSRHIRDRRIFILGTYRPEELASGNGSGPHLFENVLGEMKRTFGEFVLDLNAADQTGGRHFVDAYLDGLPNRFSTSFREKLFLRTAGHPLFTIEFVREMQARGDLLPGESGNWQEAEDLDWSVLPARVEAVIAHSLARLDADLFEVLTVASVEGEQFTAEVVAHVMGMQAGDLLKLLSHQLAKRHHLVQERGETVSSSRVLSPYSFRHGLFQQYLYDQLDPGERRRLHAAIARALEALYQDEVEIVAAQLAWHYQQARQAEKAVEFLAVAGKRAILLSGYDEAIHLLQCGLALLADKPGHSRQTREAIELLLALGEAQYRAGSVDDSLETYQKAAALAREQEAPKALAQAALGYEQSRWRFNFPAEPSRRLLEEAFGRIGEEDALLKTRLVIGRVRTLMPDISQAQFSSLSQQAIEMARNTNDRTTLYEALYLVPWGNRDPQYSQDRLTALGEMMRLAKTTGDILRQQEVLNYLVLEHFELGNLSDFNEEFRAQQKLAEKVHIPLYDYLAQLSRTSLAILLGKFSEAEELAQQALHIGRQMKVDNADGIFGIQMFTLRREQDRLREILPLVKLFVEQNTIARSWRPGLALIYSDQDLRAEAEHIFETLAADHFAGIPKDALWLTCIAYLAEVCVYLTDRDRAAHLYEFLLPYSGRMIVSGYFGACYGSADYYLGLLAATGSRWEEAKLHYQRSIELNTRMEALPWLAHTQYAFGQLLLTCGQSLNREQARVLLEASSRTAHSLGMNALIARLDKVKEIDDAHLSDRT